jgi:hypothetical protein
MRAKRNKQEAAAKETAAEEAAAAAAAAERAAEQAAAAEQDAATAEQAAATVERCAAYGVRWGDDASGAAAMDAAPAATDAHPMTDEELIAVCRRIVDTLVQNTNDRAAVEVEAVASGLGQAAKAAVAAATAAGKRGRLRRIIMEMESYAVTLERQ